jgi:hypothetical protein
MTCWTVRWEHVAEIIKSTDKDTILISFGTKKPPVIGDIEMEDKDLQQITLPADDLADRAPDYITQALAGDHKEDVLFVTEQVYENSCQKFTVCKPSEYNNYKGLHSKFIVLENLATMTERFFLEYLSPIMLNGNVKLVVFLWDSELSIFT